MADPLKTSTAATNGAQVVSNRGSSAQPKASYVMYGAPYGIDRGTCERGKLARDTATASRPMNGQLVGAQIGHSMDLVDQACVARILEYAPDRAAVRWYGAPKVDYGGPAFAITPLRTFERDGKFCREYQALATISGHDEQSYGTACRMNDGVWQTAG